MGPKVTQKEEGPFFKLREEDHQSPLIIPCVPLGASLRNCNLPRCLEGFEVSKGLKEGPYLPKKKGKILET